MRNWKGNLSEIHISCIGANGSGKTALTVKYMTKKFISEYDQNLEDTYCKHDVIGSQEFMVWIMDTVEGPTKDPSRFVGWADIFMVVYNITNRISFEYAERLLKFIAKHEHRSCSRQHLIYLIGNKTDLERYRQVSKAQGSALAAEFNAEFSETNCTEEYSLVKSIFHSAIASAAALQTQLRTASRNHSPSDSSPMTYSSDSESKSSTFGPANSPFSRRTRTKSPGAKLHDMVKSADKLSSPSNTLSPKKSNTGLKLFKLFQINND